MDRLGGGDRSGDEDANVPAPPPDEDTALLRSITPPDPAKDWQDCMLILGNEVGFLKTIFRVYCLEGRSGTGDMDTVRALPRPIPTANRMA